MLTIDHSRINPTNLRMALRNAARSPEGQVYPWRDLYPLAGQTVYACGQLWIVAGKEHGRDDLEAMVQLAELGGDALLVATRRDLRPVTWTQDDETHRYYATQPQPDRKTKRRQRSCQAVGALALMLWAASPAVALAAPRKPTAAQVKAAAQLACHQRVVDKCVDGAKPDGSTDCLDDALAAELAKQCGTPVRGEMALAKRKLAAAKAELAAAKAAAKHAKRMSAIARRKAKAAKAIREADIAECVEERTGPVDGMDESEAFDICSAEVE